MCSKISRNRDTALYVTLNSGDLWSVRRIYSQRPVDDLSLMVNRILLSRIGSYSISRLLSWYTDNYSIVCYEFVSSNKDYGSKMSKYVFQDFILPKWYFSSFWCYFRLICGKFVLLAAVFQLKIKILEKRVATRVQKNSHTCRLIYF